MAAPVRDDCFALGDRLLSDAEALAVLESSVTPVSESERVPLVAARGRILAADLIARRCVPPTMR